MNKYTVKTGKITITRPIIRVPNDFDIQCECEQILIKHLSMEIGILDCRCGRSYLVQLHEEKK